MIQIIGEASLHYNSDKISTSTIEYVLYTRLERFDVLSHRISDKQNRLDIKFIMNVRKNRPNLDDYSTIALPAFKHRLPSIVDVNPFIIHHMHRAHKPLKPIKNYLVKYIDKQLDHN